MKLNEDMKMKTDQVISFQTPKFNKGKRTVGIIKRVVGDSIVIWCRNGKSRPVLKISDLEIQYIK